MYADNFEMSLSRFADYGTTNVSTLAARADANFSAWRMSE
jgi:hypothetical protein